MVVAAVVPWFLRLGLVFESLLEWEHAYDAKGPGEDDDNNVLALLREARQPPERTDAFWCPYGLAP